MSTALATSKQAKVPSAFRRLAMSIKAAVSPTVVPAAATGNSGFWGRVRESFAGAWQRNIEIAPTHEILGFSAVYASIGMISDDIAKMRIKLVEWDAKKQVWNEVRNHAAFGPVLRKPNDYQTRIQFLSNWMTCKLIHGNVYVWKQRDNRGVVIAMHILNPLLVKVLVAKDGSIFYSMSADKLLGTDESMIVPASEIIHDRCPALFNPLYGVPPIFACAMSSTQGMRIQNNGAMFFANMSRPSGVLSSVEELQDEDFERIKKDFETNFSGANLGRLLVVDGDMKYTPMTIPAQQAQLIEQLAWTVEDVARCFHLPLYKLQADKGVKFTNAAAMDLDYYKQCLQIHIEAIEVLLDEGLSLGGTNYGVELDLDGLLRMDPLTRAQMHKELVTAGIEAPNEARQTFDLPPAKGGETPYMQQQMFPIGTLAQQQTPSNTPPPPPAPAPAPAGAKPPADDEGDDAQKSTDEALTLSTALISRFMLLAEEGRLELEEADAS